MTTVQERAELLNKVGLDVQNKASLGRVLGTGTIGEAIAKADDRMEATIRIRPDELSGKTGTAPPVVSDVTYERILDARSEPENWLTYYGAYNGQRYSPLDQINTENVKRLGPAWVFQAGTSGMIAGASTYSFEAAPIVVDGVMFLSGWDGWVWALDAKTGVEIW